MSTYNTFLGAFCAAHTDWEALLAEPPYSITVKRSGKYVIFTYSQIASDFNNPVVRDARGIIFVEGEWECPVCWPFTKFGNYGEGDWVPEICWPATVTQKVDGSLVKLWHHEGLWNWSTNGSIFASDAPVASSKFPTFQALIDEALNDMDFPMEYTFASYSDFLEQLDTNKTYLFELTSPYNRVVIPYNKIELWYLGARDNKTGKEYLCNEYCLPTGENLSGFNHPAIYYMRSFDAVLTLAKELPWDDEGYVVVDKFNNRVKVKSPAYVLAHHMRANNNITRKNLIRVILANEVSEFCVYCRDFVEELNAVEELMRSFRSTSEHLRTMLKNILKEYPMTRAEYARLVNALPSVVRPYLFASYDRIVDFGDFTSKWNELKWEKVLDAWEACLNEI